MASTVTTGSTITRVYNNFLGVDFRGDDVNLTRSPDALNVWRDYRELSGIRTRPGLRKILTFSDPVYGVYFFKGNDGYGSIVHSGNKLYRVLDGVANVLYEGVEANRSNAFWFGNAWYFKDGKNYLTYDGTTIGDVKTFTPTTSIGRKPSGGGTIYQDVNLLSGLRSNTFVADGTSTEYHLDARDLDNDYPVLVEVNDVPYTGFTVDYALGVVTFEKAPEKPLTDGQDNVRITFSRTIPGYADRIKKCTLLQVFDNRVFFAGNPDYPNVIWHCSLNDPGYCSDLDYYNEGVDAAMIRGLVAGNNALWVFREPSQANTTIFYHNPTVDSSYGKTYPSTHSSINAGCVGRAVNFGDDIIFFSDRGMESITVDITKEQVLTHRSSYVDRKLTAEANYKDMILEEWNGYLLVFVDNHVYLADSRGRSTVNDHTEYEWFYWELAEDVFCSTVENGVLYIGTEFGVYTLDDENTALDSYWTTAKDYFKSPNHQKTTNKRGCTIEATGDLSVLARTESSEFEYVKTVWDVDDYIVCRIKRKKFKDLQLQFASTTRFSLESVSIEAFIGGYIKH